MSCSHNVQPKIVVYIIPAADRLDYENHTTPNWLDKPDLDLTIVHPFVGNRDRLALDTCLSRKGVNHAEVAGKYLKEQVGAFDIVVSAPPLRCVQTADVILKKMGGVPPKIKVDSRIFDLESALHSRFLPLTELRASGLNVDENFNPNICATHKEKDKRHLIEYNIVVEVNELLKDLMGYCTHNQRDGSWKILIVGHGCTLTVFPFCAATPHMFGNNRLCGAKDSALPPGAAFWRELINMAHSIEPCEVLRGYMDSWNSWHFGFESRKVFPSRMNKSKHKHELTNTQKAIIELQKGDLKAVAKPTFTSPPGATAPGVATTSGPSPTSTPSQLGAAVLPVNAVLPQPATKT